MSAAAAFARHRKWQVDRAISEAYAHSAADTRACSAFADLLARVRRDAPAIVAAPVRDGRHPGIEALVNLSRFSAEHVRSSTSWTGSNACWRGAIASLAQHLVGRYPVAHFLAAAWYATAAEDGERKRRWYVAHARGVPFRALDVPMRMTRSMEHIFLRSQDHLGIEYAMRRAELLALGMHADVLAAAMSTPLGANLRDSDFWRTVWVFLGANAQQIDAAQVAPMIDFIQAARHDGAAVPTSETVFRRTDVRPAFTMKGRTVRSMLRLMHDWHRRLGLSIGGSTWAPSGQRPMVIEEPAEDPSIPAGQWRLLELTNASELRAEGAALHHCVASYADRCRRGASQIWSLRVTRGTRIRHVLTIEVDPKNRAVIQARGWRNRPASGKAMRLLREWTAREQLRLAL